jgi:hypothetical protein
MFLNNNFTWLNLTQWKMMRARAQPKIKQKQKQNTTHLSGPIALSFICEVDEFHSV